MSHPRVVVGMPVFNRAEYVEEAIESLLLQSYPDFALVVVDDCSTDATCEILKRYLEKDSRLHYHRNSQRVGMVQNWRHTFLLALTTVPNLEYFAFASDHDVWHPLWLENMVRELDADSDAVLAYPLVVAIRPDGTRMKGEMTQRRWETAGVIDPVTRVRLVASGIPVRAGNIVYGLFRARALEQCGIYPLVVGPDRLLMARLAVLGTFKQVPRELWMRRFWKSARRPQRMRLFRGRAPLHTHLPTTLVHTIALFHWLVLAGRARPQASRFRGVRIVAAFMRGSRHHARRRRTRRQESGREGRARISKVRRRGDHSWTRAIRRVSPRRSARKLRIGLSAVPRRVARVARR
jgi:glycosyltransferase involved in cell wall biosynthesis